MTFFPLDLSQTAPFSLWPLLPSPATVLSLLNYRHCLQQVSLPPASPPTISVSHTARTIFRSSGSREGSPPLECRRAGPGAAPAAWAGLHDGQRFPRPFRPLLPTQNLRTWRSFCAGRPTPPSALGALSPLPTAGPLRRARAGEPDGSEPQSCMWPPRRAGLPPPEQEAVTAPPGGGRPRRRAPKLSLRFRFLLPDSGSTWQLRPRAGSGSPGIRPLLLTSSPCSGQTDRQVFTHAGPSSVLPHIYPGTTCP